jgi:hypothetical protein
MTTGDVTACSPPMFSWTCVYVCVEVSGVAFLSKRITLAPNLWRTLSLQPRRCHAFAARTRPPPMLLLHRSRKNSGHRFGSCESSQTAFTPQSPKANSLAHSPCVRAECSCEPAKSEVSRERTTRA